MRFRTTVAAAVLAGAATLSFSSIALANQPDRDCPDFSSQAEAQKALDDRAGDPERLDSDDDGIACETYFDEDEGSGNNDDDSKNNDDEGSKNNDDEGQVRTKPRGGVETGDGSTGDATDVSTTLLVLSGIGAGTAAVVTVRRRIASHSR